MSKNVRSATLSYVCDHVWMFFNILCSWKGVSCFPSLHIQERNVLLCGYSCRHRAVPVEKMPTPHLSLPRHCPARACKDDFAVVSEEMGKQWQRQALWTGDVQK